MTGGAIDDMEPVPMADVPGRVVTYTIDKLVYSPSPPVVFAVVDFDGGGRAPIELTDVDPADVAIGTAVEMTFRRFFTADGIHNYFWKARPVAAGAAAAGDPPTTRARRPDMASHGIKDRVAIVGMGCTPFKEHWDKGVDDLALEASNEAFAAAGIDKDDVDAYWLGTAQSGMSGITLARALQLQDKPVTRVENYCATGSEALRQAAYAVASGAYDVAMAVGVEKVKDSGYQGLNAFPIPSDGTTRTLTAAGSFSMVAPAYAEKYGVPDGPAQAHAGPHRVEEPPQRRPQPPGPVPAGDERRPDLRHAQRGRRPQRVRLRRGGRRLGRGDRGPGRGRPPLHRHADLHQGPELRGRQRLGPGRPRLRLHLVPRDRRLRGRRLRRRPASPTRPAGSPWPRSTTASPPPSWCSWRTSGFSERGMAWKDIESGRFDLDGELPVNPDGGLKSFGHPVGASGLRMMFEAYLQLRGEAPEDRTISSLAGDREPGPHPQPRRLPRRDGQLRRHPRRRAGLSPDRPAEPARHPPVTAGSG